MEDKIIGRNPVAEALRAGREIEKILVKKGGYEGSIVPIIKKAKDRGIIIQEVEKQKLDKIAEHGSHQGIIAFAAVHEYATVQEILAGCRERGKAPFLIICDKITDPHNLGSILRTANCAGADGVIIPKRGGVGLNPVVAKTSAGAVEYTPVARVANIAQTIDWLKEQNVWTACADMAGTSMYQTDLTGAIALVIGSEGAGVSRLVREKCDFTVQIPMFGEINSLNASVAAAVLMYEVTRQNQIKNSEKGRI